MTSVSEDCSLWESNNNGGHYSAFNAGREGFANEPKVLGI